METTEFTERVHHRIRDLQDGWGGKEISNIVDDAGNQYVDLVMEGGGVLGIALVGYTYALEQVGIRFLGIGGTSAGAINAMLVAAAAPTSEAKSVRILEMLTALDMFEFVDGDGDARDFVKTLMKRPGIMKLGWKGMQVLDNLNDDLGLNPGDVFTDWISDRLRECGIRTKADLDARFQALPAGLRLRDGTPLTFEQAEPKLAVIAAEVATETKVEFPRMAGLFWKNPERVNPAQFVRASMSIPYFFHPYRVSRLPKGAAAMDRWKTLAGYRGNIPKEALFVDGGIMSNFPIDLFHGTGIPTAPTFGVKLGRDRERARKIESPIALLGAIVDSARHCLDFDFIVRNPDYRHLVTAIDTGDHNWLNFFLEDEAKIDLFERGVKAAVRFLERFDWEAYQEVRRTTAR